MAGFLRKTQVAAAVAAVGSALVAGGCGSGGTASTLPAATRISSATSVGTSAGSSSSSAASSSAGSSSSSVSSSDTASESKTRVIFSSESALKPDVLTRELAVIQQRITTEKLSGVTAGISPDMHGVTIQGPTADKDQLTMLGRPGVLGFRQVLATGAAGGAGSAPQGVSADLWQRYTALDCKNAQTSDEQPDAQIVACQNDGSKKYVLDATAVNGTSITSAGASKDSFGNWRVDVSLNSEGAAQFGQLTTRLASTGFTSQVAIVMDGVVYSAPVIQQPITDGRMQISGQFDQSTAQSLAATLQSGALPVALTMAEVSTTTS